MKFVSNYHWAPISKTLAPNGIVWTRPPKRSCASKITTSSKPFDNSFEAAPKPAAPAPIIITFLFIFDTEKLQTDLFERFFPTKVQFINLRCVVDYQPNTLDDNQLMAFLSHTLFEAIYFWIYKQTALPGGKRILMDLMQACEKGMSKNAKHTRFRHERPDERGEMSRSITTTQYEYSIVSFDIADLVNSCHIFLWSS